VDVALARVDERRARRVDRLETGARFFTDVRQGASLHDHDDRPGVAVPARRAARRDRDLLDDDLARIRSVRDDRAVGGGELDLHVDVVDEVAAGEDRRGHDPGGRRAQRRSHDGEKKKAGCDYGSREAHGSRH